MIHPSVLLTLMGSVNDTEANNSEMQSAVEKAVAGAAVVSLDQEASVVERRDNEESHNEAESAECDKISGIQWMWIFLCFGYFCYMVVIAVIFTCDGIATVRTWAVMYGLGSLLAHVVAPIKGWNSNEKWSSSIFVYFIMMYVWGGSALFPYFRDVKNDDSFCDNNLFYPCFYSVVCGMGFMIIAIVVGVLVATKHMSLGMRCPNTNS